MSKISFMKPNWPAMSEIQTRFGAGPGPGPGVGWGARGWSWCLLQGPVSVMLQDGRQTARTLSRDAAAVPAATRVGLRPVAEEDRGVSLQQPRVSTHRAPSRTPAHLQQVNMTLRRWRHGNGAAQEVLVLIQQLESGKGHAVFVPPSSAGGNYITQNSAEFIQFRPTTTKSLKWNKNHKKILIAWKIFI